MALIKCSECEKEISDKSINCIHCGNPIQKESKIDLKFPTLSEDLNIGKAFSTFKDGGSMPGFKGILIQENLNPIEKDFPSEKLKFVLHTHGIELTFGLMDEPFQIHNSQIIELIHTSKTELIKESKSVIGRSIAGGLLLGPLGAIVGGMSGIGHKENQGSKHFLIINYWDINTKNSKTLIILADKNHIKLFTEKYAIEKIKNKNEGRKAEKEESGWEAYFYLILVVILGYGAFLLVDYIYDITHNTTL